MNHLYAQHLLVKDVQEWLYLLHSRKKGEVYLCWVPAHVGIKGNEDVSVAAKEAVNHASFLGFLSLMEI